ncbi:MAG: GDP-mannose 4,6-dehydratase [Nitrososphaerota archaeon]
MTGAFGFIGSHLVERLLDGDEDVVAAGVAPPHEDNLRYIIRHKNAAKMRIAYVDFTNLQQVKALFKSFQPRIVYHLAAIASHRLSRRDPYPYLSNNYNSVLAILEATRLTEPTPKLVYTSSSTVYGDQEPPLHESLDPRPRGPYALSKLLGEQLCRHYHEEYGLECPIIRYFNIVGERCRGNIVFRVFADRISRGEAVEIYGRVVDGVFRPAERDFTYVRDAVEGTVLACERGRGFDVYNIGFGRPVSVRRVAELMMKYFGKSVGILEKELQPHEVLVSYCDNRKARVKLGWNPTTDIEEIVKRYVDWYKLSVL